MFNTCCKVVIDLLNFLIRWIDILIKLANALVCSCSVGIRVVEIEDVKKKARGEGTEDELVDGKEMLLVRA